jgi:rod shape-determining protein MreD
LTKGVNIIIGTLIFVLLQMLVAPRIAIGEIAPDFMLLLVAYFAMHRKPGQAAIAGFIVGFLQDLYNPELLGLNALTKSIVGYGVALVASKVERGSSLLIMALIGAAAFVNDFIYLLFFTGLHLGRFFILLTTVSIPSTVYTALIGIAVFKAAEALGSKAVKSFGKARP